MELIHMTHFNPEHPENHNVYLSNMEMQHATVLTDHGCELQLKNNVIGRIASNTFTAFFNKVKHSFRLSPLLVAAFESIEGSFDPNTFIDPNGQISQAIAMALYNNRDMIRSTISQVCDNHKNNFIKSKS